MVMKIQNWKYTDCPNCGENTLEATGIVWSPEVHCSNCDVVHDAQDVNRPFFIGNNSIFSLSNGLRKRISEERGRRIDRSHEQIEQSDEIDIWDRAKLYVELAVLLDRRFFTEVWKDTKDYVEQVHHYAKRVQYYGEQVQQEYSSIEVGVDDDRNPNVSHVGEMSQAEIDERIERTNQEIGGGIVGSVFAAVMAIAGIFGVSIALMSLGALISLTVVGLFFGVPLMVMGTVGVVASPVVGIWMVVSDTLSGDPWDYTGLNGDDQKQDREWNRRFDAQCAVCGQYFTLRDAAEVDTRDTATCIECGAVYEKEDSIRWRLIEGESEYHGESKRTSEWNEIAKKNEVLKNN
jgi:hypothetical protein